jgi:hypothetical protein
MDRDERPESNDVPVSAVCIHYDSIDLRDGDKTEYNDAEALAAKFVRAEAGENNELADSLAAAAGENTVPSGLLAVAEEHVSVGSLVVAEEHVSVTEEHISVGSSAIADDHLPSGPVAANEHLSLGPVAADEQKPLVPQRLAEENMSLQPPALKVEEGAENKEEKHKKKKKKVPTSLHLTPH